MAKLCVNCKHMMKQSWLFRLIDGHRGSTCRIGDFIYGDGTGVSRLCVSFNSSGTCPEHEAHETGLDKSE